MSKDLGGVGDVGDARSSDKLSLKRRRSSGKRSITPSIPFVLLLRCSKSAGGGVASSLESESLLSSLSAIGVVVGSLASAKAGTGGSSESSSSDSFSSGSVSPSTSLRYASGLMVHSTVDMCCSKSCSASLSMATDSPNSLDFSRS